MEANEINCAFSSSISFFFVVVVDFCSVCHMVLDCEKKIKFLTLKRAQNE